MSRITDKSIRPIPQPGDTRGREPAKERELPLPPGARVASTRLNAVQREDNQRLIALYHSLRDKKSSPPPGQSPDTQLKGWKKRPPDKRERQGRQDHHESTGEEPEDQDSEQ